MKSNLGGSRTFLFFFFFKDRILFSLFLGPRHMACEILVLCSETERRPLAVKAQSANHWTARNSHTTFLISTASQA